MASLRFQGVSLSFDGHVRLLEDVDVSFGPGFTGITGANGGGKTTLLRLAAGELQPESGVIHRVPGDLRVRWCRQSVEHPGDDVAAFAWADDGVSRRLRARLGLVPETLDRWDVLSPGERRRWQVGAALAAEPDVLLLDEPTNHLDSGARERLVAALRAFTGIGLLVSHDRELLDTLTTRTVRIRAGRVDVKPLPWSAARAEWEREDDERRSERASRQQEVRRLERKLADQRRTRDAAQAQRSASGRMRNRHDSDAKSIGAQTLADWAEANAGRRVSVTREAVQRAKGALVDGPVEEKGRALVLDGDLAPRPLLATLDRDSIDAGGRVLLHDVRLAWRRDDRIVVTGPNGAGKSTLVGALLGAAKLPPERLVHLPQDFGEAETVAAVEALRAAPATERGRTLQLVAALGADPERLLATRHPSHGEARKLALAHGLARAPWAVVLDEPTNHLDLPSIERLEAALAAYRGALLVVTHDRRFAAALGCSEWRLVDGRVSTEPLNTRPATQ